MQGIDEVSVGVDAVFAAVDMYVAEHLEGDDRVFVRGGKGLICDVQPVQDGAHFFRCSLICGFTRLIDRLLEGIGSLFGAGACGQCVIQDLLHLFDLHRHAVRIVQLASLFAADQPLVDTQFIHRHIIHPISFFSVCAQHEIGVVDRAA